MRKPGRSDLPGLFLAPIALHLGWRNKDCHMVFLRQDDFEDIAC